MTTTTTRPSDNYYTMVQFRTIDLKSHLIAQSEKIA